MGHLIRLRVLVSITVFALVGSYASSALAMSIGTREHGALMKKTEAKQTEAKPVAKLGQHKEAKRLQETKRLQEKAGKGVTVVRTPGIHTGMAGRHVELPAGHEHAPKISAPPVAQKAPKAEEKKAPRSRLSNAASAVKRAFSKRK